MTLSESIREAAAKALYLLNPIKEMNDLPLPSTITAWEELTEGERDYHLKQVDAVAPLLAEGLMREVEELTKERDTLRRMHLQMCDLAVERFRLLEAAEAQLAAAREAAQAVKARILTAASFDGFTKNDADWCLFQLNAALGEGRDG